MDQKQHDELIDEIYRLRQEYIEKVEELMKPLSDEDLAELQKPFTPEDGDKVCEILDGTKTSDWIRAKAFIERCYRIAYARATPVIENGGAYCVYHGQDMRLCDPKEHGFDDEEDA